MKRKVFDIEQFSNFHSNLFYDIDTKQIDVFVIHESRDERVEYFQYLVDCKANTGLIGFNNIGYDKLTDQQREVVRLEILKRKLI